MGYYYGYYRRETDYDQLYYYFSPILSDLRKEFFTLSPLQLSCYWEKYRQEYGDSACSYAIRTYPRWKNGTVSMAAQTLSRMLKHLPSVIEPEKRLVFIQKLLEHYKKDNKDHISFDGTWENFEVQIVNARKELQQRFQKIQKDGVNWAPKVPYEVSSVATWLFDNDAVALNQVMSNAVMQEWNRMYFNAVWELDKFRLQCLALAQQRTLVIQQEMQKRKKDRREVQRTVQGSFSLPNAMIFICIKEPERDQPSNEKRWLYIGIFLVIIFIVTTS